MVREMPQEVFELMRFVFHLYKSCTSGIGAFYKKGKPKSLPPMHEVKMPPRVISSYFDAIFNLDFLHMKK